VRLRRRLARRLERLRSLRLRIALVGSVFVAASMYVSGTMQIASIEEQVGRTLVDFQRREVEGTAAQIAARIADRAETLLAMARDGAERGRLARRTGATDYLLARPTLSVLFAATAVARPDGTLLAFVERGRALPVRADVADRPAVKEALGIGSRAVSTPCSTACAAARAWGSACRSAIPTAPSRARSTA
jgi:hypothetical protein